MSIFEAVKQSVTTRQAAERYGIRVERNGMCRCPFHEDKTPSMKLDRRYYCFGCGATGDVIDFVSRLRGIGSMEAAILLAQDFAIPYEGSADKPCKPQKQNTEEQNYENYDLLIGMDRENLRNMRRICGGDPDGKLSLLLDHTGRSRDVADPWYTGNFEATWQDVLAGCQALLAEIR